MPSFRLRNVIVLEILQFMSVPGEAQISQRLGEWRSPVAWSRWWMR